MTRQCCVCKRVFEDGRWVPPRPEHLEDENVTHGYCEECSADFTRAVAEYFALARPGAALATGV